MSKLDSALRNEPSFLLFRLGTVVAGVRNEALAAGVVDYLAHVGHLPRLRGIPSGIRGYINR